VLAQELAGRDDEAARRTAVSRAYYSAYCYARDRARINTEGARDAHKLVHEFYERRKSSKLRDFGANQLPALHRSRKDADYDEDCEITSTKCQWAIMKARQMISVLEQLNDEQIKA
jgi:hypothetical protein